MGSSASALFRRLGKPDAIRYQVLAYLFLARIHNSVKLSYETYLAKENKSSRGQTTQTRGKARLQVKVRSNNMNNGNYYINHSKSPDDRWDWRGFPTLWDPLRLYDLASSSCMLYVSVRTLFEGLINRLFEPLSRWLFELPANCLLMGRVAVPPPIDQLFGVLLATFHLTWRYVQANSKHNRLLTMLVFLLFSDQDVERFYALMEANESRDYLPISSYTNGQEEEREEEGDLELEKSSSKSLSAVLRQQQHKSTTGTLDGNIERLFRQVMCYKVAIHDGSKQIYFKLRPNRTREARRQLKSRLVLVTIATVVCFSLQFLVATSLICLAILSDYHHEYFYPGCYPLLDERKARGELSPWPITITLNEHHLISGLIFDFLTNIFVWGDSGLSLTFVPALAYLLNYDLLLYWAQLNRKLELILARGKQVCYMAHLEQVNYLADGSGIFARSFPRLKGCSSSRRSRHEEEEEEEEEVESLDNILAPRYKPPSSVITKALRIKAIQRLEFDIHELQFEIYDFFHQVRRADLLVGDTLTASIAIWLVSCAYVTYNLRNNDFSSSLVRLILMLGFFVITFASYHLFELRRCCLVSYQALCSLIAYDQTLKKQTSSVLLEFYLNNDTSTYHLGRSYAYKPTTFITIIGWSFSCFFIVNSFFGPHNIKI